MTTAAPELVKPAHLWIPERRGSYGDEAVDLARIAGREMDAEQALAVDALLSFKAGGRWAAMESAWIEARQNGKTVGVEVVVMFDLWMLPPDRIVWTAHRFKTAREAFDDFDMMIASTPELSRRVKKIHRSHGEESIELHHPKSRVLQGAVLDFMARESGGGRGLGGKRTVFDEALILSGAALGAIVPLLSARPDPQVMYASSGAKDNPPSAHLRALRDRGRAGGDPSLIYVEWADLGSWVDPPCRDGVKCTHLFGIAQGCALDDEERWARANHMLGRRRADGSGITLDYVRAERRLMKAVPREFGRERLGWHEDPPSEDDDVRLVEFRKAWPDLADPSAPAPVKGLSAVAIEVAPDRGSTAVAVAWWLDQRVLVMSTELAGTGGVAAAVVALRRELDPVDISLHAGGQAGPLLKRINRALRAVEGNELEVRAVSTQEAAQATGALRDLVDEETLGHLAQPELAAEVAVAVLRNSGDGEIWDRKDETAGSIKHLFAVTLAAHGLLQEVPEGPVEIEGSLMAGAE